ncbi:MAG: DegT/DnrJ/EryC1/StrS family aminotransferase [Methanosarcinaceae archaeon]|nr:DegT/DnrJ/EryC1/StrS family aminotransferase [Methanosarcinaceae archaeon]
MIPRLKPAIGARELAAAFHPPRRDDVERFERSFAELMGQKHALAFPYGRTGLMLLLEALGLDDKEIICPAYTCVVVPHAITYSGNKPVFIDCEVVGFNMDLNIAKQAISEKTGAIIATSLFGYPVNLDQLDEIRKRHPNVFIIQDCAHSFAAEWNGRPVQKEGIAALFGLNISKTLTSIFGGMITTDNEDVYHKLKTIRQQRLKKPGWGKGFRRLLYLLAVYPAFWEPVYGLINRLERLGLLNYFVKYYDDSKIDMPLDYLEGMCEVEARVGRVNIGRYETIIDKRRAAAQYYFKCLTDRPDFKMTPEVEGATYSHFVVRVDDRDEWLQRAIRKGIQLGWLIEYNIPEMEAYGGYPSKDFPVAGDYASRAINLPVWGGEFIAQKVVKLLKRYCI